MSSTATALVSTPLRTASHAVTSSARSAGELIATTAKTAQSLTSPIPGHGSAPSTPGTVPSSPGTFRHPRLTEIIQRRAKTTFTERNLRNATLYGGAVILSFIFGDFIYNILNLPLSILGLPLSRSMYSAIILLLRLLFLSNIYVSLRPILPYVSKTDDVSDIPLTPSQRALLGLPPSATKLVPLNNTIPSTTTKPTTPATPLSAFITPPRYRRSSSSSFATTPPASTDRRSISANYSTSPLSTSRYTLGFSPSPVNQSQSQYRGSPGSASPLLHKAVTRPQPESRTQDYDFGRSDFGSGRSSFGASTSAIGRSQSLKEGGAARRGTAEQDPMSPSTPLVGKRALPGLNYKWLYDKRLGGSQGGGRLSTGISGGMVKSESMNF